MSNWSRWQTPLGLLLCAAISDGPIVTDVGQAVANAWHSTANADYVAGPAQQVVIENDLHAHSDLYERLVWNNATYSATGEMGASNPYFA